MLHYWSKSRGKVCLHNSFKKLSKNFKKGQNCPLKSVVFFVDFIFFKDLVSKEKLWYIVGKFSQKSSSSWKIRNPLCSKKGPGSCHGDSGGPAFQPAIKDDKPIYVLVGVTSSGTSNIGNCGGINNPTHYTRLTRITPWLSRYVNQNDICWAGAETKPAPL